MGSSGKHTGKPADRPSGRLRPTPGGSGGRTPLLPLPGVRQRPGDKPAEGFRRTRVLEALCPYPGKLLKFSESKKAPPGLRRCFFRVVRSEVTMLQKGHQDSKKTPRGDPPFLPARKKNSQLWGLRISTRSYGFQESLQAIRHLYRFYERGAAVSARAFSLRRNYRSGS